MARINNIEFTDNSKKIIKALENKANQWLAEASGEIQGQAARNSRVDTGQLKGSWNYKVDENKKEAFIGSPLENAIYEEYGTGEYAVNGDGRKTAWKYKDRKGTWHYTKGKTPNRTLQRAFRTKRNICKKRLQQLLSEVDG